MEHSVVQRAGNVEKFSYDFFEELDLSRCHGRSVINLCHLLFCTVLGRRVPGRHIVILLGECVLELEDCFLNLNIRGSLESAICIVPVKVHTYVHVAFPVRFYGVVVLECFFRGEGCHLCCHT